MITNMLISHSIQCLNSQLFYLAFLKLEINNFLNVSYLLMHNKQTLDHRQLFILQYEFLISQMLVSTWSYTVDDVSETCTDNNVPCSNMI